MLLSVFNPSNHTIGFINVGNPYGIDTYMQSKEA